MKIIRVIATLKAMLLKTDCAPAIEENKNFPRPEDLKDEIATWVAEEEVRTRAQFLKALPSLKEEVERQIHRQFGKPERLVTVDLSRELRIRPDLIASEIVDWLRPRGWLCTHSWCAIRPVYALFLSPLPEAHASDSSGRRFHRANI